MTDPKREADIAMKNQRRFLLFAALGVLIPVLSGCGRERAAPAATGAKGPTVSGPGAAATPTPRELLLGNWHLRERNDDIYLKIHGDGVMVGTVKTAKRSVTNNYRYKITSETADTLFLEVEGAGLSGPVSFQFRGANECEGKGGHFAGTWRRQ